MNALKLLVSINEVDEAIDAIKGGADIIDVKNPKEGALGANFPWIISEVKNIIGQRAQISATIGDMPNLPGTASLAALGAAFSGADYIKIGLFGPKSFDEALYMMSNVVKSVKGFSSRVKVVAASYADYVEFGGLDPLLLPSIAFKAGAEGVLIDVKNKGESNLFNFLNPSQIRLFVNESHKFGLIAALAGKLGKENIVQIQELGADIIGVRRAVCNNHNFHIGKVQEVLVSDFLKIMKLL